jgi:hypothetical protein
MHHHAQPAALHCRMDKSMSVRAVQAPLQAVKDHQTRFMARLSRVFAPGQIDKIAVRQFQALPVGSKAQFAADQPRQHGLQMTIAYAAHRMKLLRVVFGGVISVGVISTIAPEQ